MVVKYLLVPRVLTHPLPSLLLQRLTDRSDSSSDIDRMGMPVCSDIVDAADGNNRTFHHSTTALCMASVTDGHVCCSCVMCRENTCTCGRVLQITSERDIARTGDSAA